MKTSFRLIFAMFLITIFFSNSSIAQNTTVEVPRMYMVQKNDGTKFIGEILTSDAREILMRTADIGEVYIPKHEIKEIKELLPELHGQYITDELFATRYFITTNGLPINKGENYIQWNLYGPDFQFGIADNFGVGIMTSWAAIPIIATAKYSIDLGKNKSMALGMLAGTGSWALPEFGLLLPYVSFTLGDRKNNLTFSSGYGEIFFQNDEYNPLSRMYEPKNRKEGRMLFAVAGMAKINEKFSLVFDSFISPWGPEYTHKEEIDKGYWDSKTGVYVPDISVIEVTDKSPNLALILPGIRWQIDADRAFQFGFTGFYFDNEFIPFPIPMVQWYRRL